MNFWMQLGSLYIKNSTEILFTQWIVYFTIQTTIHEGSEKEEKKKLLVHYFMSLDCEGWLLYSWIPIYLITLIRILKLENILKII
jgi:hypothetical protein